MANEKIKRTYRNPPIVETVCEFRLPPTAEWDITIPCLIYDKVKDSFGKKKRGTISQPDSTQPQAVPPKIQTFESVRFLSDDELKLIQVWPGT